jgi:hypothetical protein
VIFSTRVLNNGRDNSCGRVTIFDMWLMWIQLQSRCSFDNIDNCYVAAQFFVFIMKDIEESSWVFCSKFLYQGLNSGRDNRFHCVTILDAWSMRLQSQSRFSFDNIWNRFLIKNIRNRYAAAQTT